MFSSLLCLGFRVSRRSSEVIAGGGIHTRALLRTRLHSLASYKGAFSRPSPVQQSFLWRLQVPVECLFTEETPLYGPLT